MARIKAPKSSKGKVPNPHEPRLSTNRDILLFGLEYLDSTYSLGACTKDEKAAFGDTLVKLSKLTWAELGNASRHGSGYEIIPQDQIRSALPTHLTPEVNLIAFRFFGRAPMVGYRDGRIFYILWLDRNFTLYPHGN